MLSARRAASDVVPPRPNAFRKSSRHPLNMSRTAANKTTGHAPSTLMLERMHEAATDLATLATTTAGWRFANERNGAMLYEMTGRNLPATVTTARKFGRGAGHSSDYYLVRAVTTVHTGVAAMLDLLHSSTTDEYRLVMRQVFQQYFQNGVTLNKLTCTTPPPFAEDPDAGAEGARRSFSEDDAYSVNWLTLKAQAKLGNVENHRDFTLVSYQDAFVRHDLGMLDRVGRGTARMRSASPNVQHKGRLVGVHVLSSVNFQDVPELPIPDCTDRLHFRNSGFVIEETNEPNTFRLSLFLSLLPTKATLKYARKYQRWLQTLASCVGNLAQVLRPEVTLHCLSKLTWKQSDHCFMCLKMFRTFRRCHHCRFCGEAVCGACSTMVNMAGYDISDGSSSTLAASSSSLVSSQRQSPDNTRLDPNFAGTGDVWHMTAGETTRSSNSSTRRFREARGCNACVADLRQGLTASVFGPRRNSDSGEYEPSNPLARTGYSGSNEDEDIISYDSSDDGNYERLGSIATYIPSDNGGAIVQQPQMFNASEIREEHGDEYPAASEELQDKFPAVDEPAPPRFRNVSDPDQLRRMRNVSDPELPMRLKDKHSIVSMSTATSSFSRSSHDTRFGDNASQYSRGTNFSAMSDGSSACDLSRDPDILALAGLTLKPSADDPWEATSQKTSTMHHSRSCEQLTSQVPEEPEKEQEATSPVKQQIKDEDSFRGKFISKPWPGSSTSSNGSESRYRSNTVKSRDDLTLHPADVLRHRSQTTAALAATAPIAHGSKPNALISSIVQASKPVDQAPNNSNGQFHFSIMKSEPTTTAAAIVAAVAAASNRPNRSLAPMITSTQNEAIPSSNPYATTAVRRGSLPMQMHRLPASVPEGSTASDESDMIPLPQAEQPGFVLFSDSRRESIMTRPDNGEDMIPLDF